jgi:ankyrin repeat protein
MQAAVDAVRGGDIVALQRLLAADPALATARVDGCRTLLHVAADWPGHFPNNVASAALLIAHGADVNAPFVGRHSETPLHGAASCDDVDLIDALLDRGADMEAPGSVIDGGSALADAVAFGQWKAARRLIERGAKANLWQAAALGLMDRVEQSAATASPQEVTAAFWCACHGGQRATAEYLLGRGADANWIGYDGLTPIDAARRSGATELVAWLQAH